jgi:hypothetical protein
MGDKELTEIVERLLLFGLEYFVFPFAVLEYKN